MPTLVTPVRSASCSASLGSQGRKRVRLLLVGNSISPSKDYPELPKAADQMESVARHFASSERQVYEREKATPSAYLQSNPEQAVSGSVKRGFIVVTSKEKGSCAVCHLVGQKNALFTDSKFHDIGVGVQAGKTRDLGLYAVSHNEADRGKFKAPSLRGVSLRAPYMHDGSLRDLNQVLDFYTGGGNFTRRPGQGDTPARVPDWIRATGSSGIS